MDVGGRVTQEQLPSDNDAAGVLQGSSVYGPKGWNLQLVDNELKRLPRYARNDIRS